MSQNSFIREIQAYCQKVGHKPSTVCVRAIGNGRFFDRLLRREAKTKEDMALIRQYMADNPPPADQVQEGEAA